MPAKKWHIWSWDARNGMWLQVGEGLTEGDAREGAVKRNTSAAKYGLADARYVALPDGELPGDPDPQEG